MKELSQKQKELNRKQSELFLYEFGQEYTDKICADTDALHEKYKDLEIPDSLDIWFDRFTSEQKKLERKKISLKKRRIIAKRVAVFLVAFIAVSGSLTLGVEAFRIRFFNIFFIDNDTHTDLSVLEGNSGESNITKPEGWSSYYYPSYLPIGYDLNNYGGVEGYRELHFDDGMNDIYMVELSGEDSFLSDLDTEGVEPDFITVNGYDAIYVYKNDTSTIAWLIDDTLIKLSGPIDKSEMIKIAQNVKK